MATASQLLYECPYARSAGRFAPALHLDITAALGVLNHRVSSHAAPKIARPTPFVPPPPAAVTTHSFGELLKSRTRPGRYGPAEIYERPVTESQEAGFKVALASLKR